MSKEEKVVDTFITVVEKATAILKELATLIEQSESENEADIVLDMVRKELGEEIATKIWDDLVDWDKVNWK